MTLPASLEDFIGPPIAPPTPVDWSEVAHVLGTDLPGDYKELADKYPTLFIAQWLPVSHPATPEPPHNPYSLPSLQWEAITQSRFIIQARPGALEAYDPRDRRTRRSKLPMRHLPFPAYPEPGGMMQWGLTENNTMCCWLTEGDPDEWTIIIVDDVIAWQYLGNITEFLSDLVTRRVICPNFPEGFPNEGMETLQFLD